MSALIARENGSLNATELPASTKRQADPTLPSNGKKLRRQNAFTSLDQNSLDNRYTGLPTGSVSSAKTASKVELIIAQADILCEQNLLRQARDTLLTIGKKSGAVLIRLQDINRQIKANGPQSTKGKKSIPQKLCHNLDLAKKQQSEEMPKSLRIQRGTIPEFITLSRLQTRQIVSVSTQVAGKTVGIAHCQGIRPTMEDTFLATEVEFTCGEKVVKGELYGVFDGHGGTETSKFLRESCDSFLIASLLKHNDPELTDEGIYSALIECFAKLDDACANHENGATVTIAFLLEGKVWVANCGDARTILSDNRMPVQMSHDAKITDSRFIKKVEKLGGIITIGEGGPRVQRLLNCAGSIGDRFIIGEEGNCCIPSKPQITVHAIQKGKGFVFLGCDGHFDVATTNATVQVIHDLMDGGEPVEHITKRLVYSDLKSGSTDNITVILVPL